MLLRIGFEPDAVSKWNETMDLADAVAAHRSFCWFLMKHGALCFRSPAEEGRFWEELRSSPLWRTPASHLWFESRRHMSAARWRVDDRDDVDLQLAAPAARVRATAGGGPERCRISRYADAERYQRLEALRDSGRVRARTAREDVWKDWLAALADHFTEVTVYDPYIGRQFLDGGPKARTNGVAASLWLIGELASSRLAHRVGLVTLAQQPGKEPVDEVFEAMRGTLAAIPERGTIEEITVTVGARRGARGADAIARAHSRDLHDRHIRFSGGSRTGAALVVPAGLDRLGPDPVAVDVHLQYRPDLQGMSTASLEDLREKEEIVAEATPGRSAAV